MEQLSHHGHDGLERFFAGCDELGMKGIDLGLVADRRQGRHV